MAIFAPLRIDTIEMIVALPAAGLYQALWSLLHELYENRKELFPGWSIIKKHPGYAACRVMFSPAPHRRVAAIEVGVAKGKHRWGKMTLYPGNFKAGEFVHWQWRVASLFHEYGYARFFFEGRVTRVDFAVDNWGAFGKNVIPYYPGARVSSRYSENGVLGTLYLGSKGSCRFFRIYDKVKQLSEVKKQKAQFPSVTRFEATLRKVGCAACELHEEVPNPFEDLLLAPIAVADALSSEPAWVQFLDACQLHGSARALLDVVQTKTRKLFRKRLMAISKPVPLLNWPGAVEDALQQIAPDPAAALGFY